MGKHYRKTTFGPWNPAVFCSATIGFAPPGTVFTTIITYTFRAFTVCLGFQDLLNPFSNSAYGMFSYFPKFFYIWSQSEKKSNLSLFLLNHEQIVNGPLSAQISRDFSRGIVARAVDEPYRSKICFSFVRLARNP